MLHPALTKDRVAVITGAASGIGLAAAVKLAGLGMKLWLADVDAAALDAAVAEVARHAARPGSVRGVVADVARREDVERLKNTAYETFGEVALLMNNAGVEGAGGGLLGDPARWRSILDVNLWGVIHRRAGLRPRDDRAAHALRDRQHRFETGDHLPAGQNNT